MKTTELIHVDDLKLYFGYDTVINDKIHIHQPTIREIVEMGEAEYYSMVHTITATPSDMKSNLWDMGIDWEDIKDFDLFLLLAPTLPQEKTRLVLGDIDLTKMQTFLNQDNGEIALADVENEIYIDRLIYMKIVEVIRRMHGLKANIEHAANKKTKEIMIECDRQTILEQKSKGRSSVLFPLISAVKCKMCCTKDYILNMGIVEFMDDLNRLQVIDHADHLMNGAYSGMIDTKKINKKEMDWIRDLHK